MEPWLDYFPGDTYILPFFLRKWIFATRARKKTESNSIHINISSIISSIYVFAGIRCLFSTDTSKSNITQSMRVFGSSICSRNLSILSHRSLHVSQKSSHIWILCCLGNCFICGITVRRTFVRGSHASLQNARHIYSDGILKRFEVGECGIDMAI